MDAGWEDTGWHDLAPGVARTRLPRWDATSGAVAGPDGLLVVDTGGTLREGAAVRRAVRERFGRPVTDVVLTHPHFDHVLGTAAFAGVRVYGAAGTERLLAAGSPAREELLRDAVRHGVSRAEAAEAEDVLVAPRHPVSGELSMSLGGGRRVVLAALGPAHSAHSGHDLAVLVAAAAPSERAVVFCGDLVEESGAPQAGPDAHPARWPAALDRLLALGGEHARYVPGHGAVVDAAFVRAQRDQLARRFAAP